MATPSHDTKIGHDQESDEIKDAGIGVDVPKNSPKSSSASSSTTTTATSSSSSPSSSFEPATFGSQATQDAIEGLSLATLFTKLQVSYARIQDSPLPSADPELQQQIKQCLNDSLQVAKKVSSEGVFSPNETLADIHTESLPYVI